MGFTRRGQQADHHSLDHRCGTIEPTVLQARCRRRHEDPGQHGGDGYSHPAHWPGDLAKIRRGESRSEPPHREIISRRHSSHAHESGVIEKSLEKYMRSTDPKELEESYQLLKSLVPVKPYPTLEGFKAVFAAKRSRLRKRPTQETSSILDF